MTRPGRIHIGTSGWHYQHWRGPFYPPDLPSAQWLAYYAQRLDSVELNNSFYHLPAVTSLEQWRGATPPGFTFAVKASRFITHLKKLKDADQHLPKLLERVEVLGAKLGPLLFQLPPGWPRNLARLEGLLAALPAGLPCALEFRDPSWWDQSVYALLERYGAAFCVFDLNRRLSPWVVTAGLVYLRLHGPGGPYQGCYGREFLADLAGRLGALAAEGRDVFCYFDNDEGGYAVQNALELRELAVVAGRA